MVHNDPKHPELARESQDVDAPPVRIQEGAHHTGRGRFIYTLPCLALSCHILCRSSRVAS